MQWSWSRRGSRAAVSFVGVPSLLFVAALALGGCGPDGGPGVAATQTRGATVAFESIDGPPPAQFGKLVEDLNTEAHAHRLAVLSRNQPSAYRVRGYLSAEKAKGETTISWVWDVFDRDQHRALRITGVETAEDHRLGAWKVADDAMLQRIASSSMDQLAAFLTSSAVAPNAPVSTPAQSPAQVALIGDRNTTPEQAGIFRIFKPHEAGSEPPASPAVQPVSGRADDGRKTAAMPLAPRRPTEATALSAGETLMLAASSSADGR